MLINEFDVSVKNCVAFEGYPQVLKRANNSIRIIDAQIWRYNSVFVENAVKVVFRR